MEIMIILRDWCFIPFADIDECELRLHDCDVMNASCSNNNGSFDCSCHQGYHGDGHNCFAASNNVATVARSMMLHSCLCHVQGTPRLHM